MGGRPRTHRIVLGKSEWHCIGVNASTLNVSPENKVVLSAKRSCSESKRSSVLYGPRNSVFLPVCILDKFCWHNRQPTSPSTLRDLFLVPSAVLHCGCFTLSISCADFRSFHHKSTSLRCSSTHRHKAGVCGTASAFCAVRSRRAAFLSQHQHEAKRKFVY